MSEFWNHRYYAKFEGPIEGRGFTTQHSRFLAKALKVYPKSMPGVLSVGVGDDPEDSAESAQLVITFVCPGDNLYQAVEIAGLVHEEVIGFLRRKEGIDLTGYCRLFEIRQLADVPDE